jgi:protocatechuate 3,4-dioxygenase beta subunit
MPATGASSPLLPNATVPATLVQTTIRAATCLALAGTAIESIVPANVATLSREVVRNLLFAKVRLACVLVILGIATAAISLTISAPALDIPLTTDAPPNTASEQAIDSQAPEMSKTTELNKSESVVIRGQVLDPDGKPVAGARLVLTIPSGLRVAYSQYLTLTGKNGRFEAMIPPDAPDADGRDRPVIAAWYRGLGPDWVAIDARTAKKDVTLRLRRDDVPIEGRVLGLEGRPVAGATVSITYMADFPPELLKRFQQNGGVRNHFLWDNINFMFLGAKEVLIPAVKTGPDGRFRVTGIGRDRASIVVITGESIELSETFVMNSSDPAYAPILLPANRSGKQELLGPRFDLAVLPGREIEGIIRDHDTGRPIAGAKVETTRWDVSISRSDAQGRYRVIGWPKGANIDMGVIVEGQPYVSERIFKEKATTDPTGLGPVRVDFTLKRGVWVEGKVTNQASARPVRAVVRYHPLRDNPHLKAWPDGTFVDNTDFGNYVEFLTDAYGRFRAVALPGGGVLTVRTNEPGYLAAAPLSPQVAGNVLHDGNLPGEMKSFQAVVPINLGNGETTTIPDITLLPGRTQHIQVFGPGGLPAPEIRVFGPLSGSGYQDEGRLINGAEFTFVHPRPGTAEELEVVQEDRSVGKLLQMRGDERDPIKITLQPTGTVAGRLVDDETRARPLIPIMVNQHLKTRSFWRSSVCLTDAEGRFRITGLVPEVVYSLSAAKNHGTIGYDPDEAYILNDRHRWIMKHQWAIKPGETQDWGDVQVKVNLE